MSLLVHGTPSQTILDFGYATMKMKSATLYALHFVMGHAEEPQTLPAKLLQSRQLEVAPQSEIIDTQRDKVAPVAQLECASLQRQCFLFHRMYRAPSVMAVRAEVTRMIDDLFPLFLRQPDLLPPEWQGDVRAAGDEVVLARVVADYVAGMTDRFAILEHARLFGTTTPLSR